MTTASAAGGVGRLHLLCGKIASGKSTLARRLAATPQTLLISEDDWLARLYPGEVGSLEDYVRCSRRLRAALYPLVTGMLGARLSVVLDFPANTMETRRGLRRLVADSGADHRLHFLDVPDEVCKLRLRQRNAAGSHAFAPSEADFDRFTRHFQAPAEAEGFVVERHAPA